MFVVAALAVSFVLCAVPVLVSDRVNDPLSGEMSDHLRHRYCAAQLATQPIRSLTRPLGELHAEDASPNRFVSWQDSPCTQAGVVFFAVHAPFHLALELGALSPAWATTVYVLLMLACAHLFLLLALRRDGTWPAALLLYPWIVTMALMGLATPLTSVLGLLAYTAYADGRAVRGTLFLALAVSSFNRWVVVVPGVLFVSLVISRRAALDDLAAHWRTWRGRLPVLAAGGLLLWSLLATVLVWVSWKELPPRAWLAGTVLRAFVLVGFAVALVLWRRSALAAVGLSFALFLFGYRSEIMPWYIEPLAAAFVLARRRSELLLWAVMVVVASQSFERGPNLVAIRNPVTWIVQTWAGLLG